jgi:hypothetical protein
MTDEQGLPPRDFFDDKFARDLVGRTLLVGITERQHDGTLIRRRQVFGTVTVAERGRGICVRVHADNSEFWLPPDTRGISRAEPGDYRNRTTGEVVSNPDYTASWAFAAPESKH